MYQINVQTPSEADTEDDPFVTDVTISFVLNGTGAAAG